MFLQSKQRNNHSSVTIALVKCLLLVLHMFFQYLVLLLGVWIIGLSSTVQAGATPTTTTTSSRTDFIDCSDPCNGGDVNYELTASIRIMNVLNTTYKGRTYSRPSDGPDQFMGPTMRVRPGQSLWIKLVNNMTHDEEPIGPTPPTRHEYWKMLQNPGERIKYQYYRKAPPDASLMKVDEINMPKNFDATNLHLHGLDVQVHMFDPVNTHNPDAPHIAIQPGQCYCYKFDIPDHHPPGMYWYHPHLHGSTALQIWSGMLGLLYVEGPLMDELTNYGVTHSHEFVIWDPAFQNVSRPTHDLEVDDFLMGQTTLSKIHPFMVNGQINPTFTVPAGEVLHFRTLCGTIENENTFIIYKQGEEDRSWDEAAIPFWVIGVDGVTLSMPIQKHIVVMAGGQRYELLIKLDEPGTYVISQQGIQGMQFFDMYGHPHDQILATIVVTANNNESQLRTPIPDMRFTPGYSPDESIQAHDIVATETIVFSMGANRDQAPFPQYYVNGLPFDPNRLDFMAHPGEAREYILINANHNVHPFHIHVNRFQVKEMGSELSTTKYPALAAVLDFDYDTPHGDTMVSAWRDTVIVPPNGRARIWVQYKNYTGKTLFHCHFLAHEDTGMMSTLFIGPPDWVFHWRDHVQLLGGMGMGILLSGLLLFLVVALRKEPTEAEEMKKLKSKALD